MKWKIILFVLMTLVVTSCSNVKSDPTYPLSNPKDQRRAKYGKLTGEDGLVLFGGRKDEEDSSAAGIGINSYLWRASLDTISFMPLASADPFGGVIITDWYEASDSKGERFKINILILDKQLRSNAVKVKVFKQVNRSGRWEDTTPSEKVSTELENKILTRARELRIEKEKK